MKQPQFTHSTIRTPLWIESANEAAASRAACRARCHRRAFLFLAIAFGLAFARFIMWFNSLP
jgi:hypothetical protein